MDGLVLRRELLRPLTQIFPERCCEATTTEKPTTSVFFSSPCPCAENPKDWSDHALWWPQKNEWLTRTRSTLDQCGVHADALLHFTPMHKTLRVQLPDLRHLDCRVDFSIKTFNAVINLCKDLDIRHPEELSLSKPLDAVHLKKNFAEFPKRKLPQNEHGGRNVAGEQPHQPAADTNTFIPTFSGSCNSLDNPLNGSGGGGSSGPFGSCAPMPVHRQPHLLGPAPISSPTGVSGCLIFNSDSNFCR